MMFWDTLTMLRTIVLVPLDPRHLGVSVQVLWREAADRS